MAAALLLGATAACADAPSAPSGPPTHDLSTVIAQTLAVAFGTYLPGAAPVDPPGACPYSTAASAFVCAPASVDSRTYTLSYVLLDASGRMLTAPSDRAVTMRAVIDRRGRRTATADDLTVTTDLVAHHEMIVSGLQSTTRVLSGTVTSHLVIDGNLASSPHTVQDVVGATTNVAVDEGARWPRAGAITASDVTTVLASGAASPTQSRSTTELSFDGTSVVSITTSTDGSTLRCRFDLDGQVPTTCS